MEFSEKKHQGLPSTVQGRANERDNMNKIQA